MRLTRYAYVVLLSATCLLSSAKAAPFTGYGPGGFIDDNGGTSNLALWFRSDKGLFQDTAGTNPATLSGQSVSRWNDQSGYGRNLTTFGGNPAPILQLNQVNGTQSVVRVDDNTGGGLPSSLITPSFTFNQPEYVWSTQAFRGGSAGNPTVWDGSAGNTMRLYGGGGAGSTSFNTYAGGGDASGAVGAVNSYHNLGVLFSGAGSTFRTDGNQVGTGGSGTSGAGGFSIGGGVWGSSQAADADFSEIFLFNRALNSTEQIIVDNYQSAHSGIAFAGAVLANDHYIGDNSGQGNLDFGVFGIGDDGTNEVDNAGMEGFGVQVAANSLGGPNQWVFAGHDNGSNGLTTPSTFGGQRWERSWYLDTTSIVSADLAFNWIDASNTGTYNSAFNRLYYSPTLGGPFSLLATGTVNTGNQSVEFLNVTLTDGYYTLGSVGVPEPSTLALLGLGIVGLAVKAQRRHRNAA